MTAASIGSSSATPICLAQRTLGTGSYDALANDFSLAWNTQSETPGPHTLTVDALDCAGNHGDATISWYVIPGRRPRDRADRA